MCGRYPQSQKARDSVRVFGITAAPAPRPETWNLAPSTLSLVVRQPEGKLTAEWLKWGLVVNVPGLAPINARVETAETKRMFRESWRWRRCLIPADGWYEWKADKGRKQPYFFYRRNGEPILFAGLWNEESFALLTTAADGAINDIHHRRPLALRVSEGRSWIEAGASSDELASRLLPSTEIEFHAVSPRVSIPREDGPDLVKPWKDKTSDYASDLFRD
jgi:putative SOS response-associated peptidase YedK